MKPVQTAPIALIAILILALAPVSGNAEDDAVTQGAMQYTLPDSGEVRELPLEHTDVHIAVSGTVAEVRVTQTFSNPLPDRLEATYVFPLPDRAAVYDMSMRVGDRLIRGEIHRREEARRIYEEARASGHLTGLLDQERPNIFTQRVANILPGEAIEVVIDYVEDLHFDHGVWRLAFPTVVGPRYIPGSTTGRSGSGWSADTDRVPDASRITPPVLEPGRRSGHDIGITVELAPGFAIRDLSSTSHEVTIHRHGSDRAMVTLAPLDTIPNKDFVLSWSTAAGAVESTVVAHRLEGDGTLTLILQPPAQPRAAQVVPRELVFVIDSSGSMSGEPISACKQLVRKALKRLRADDTFRLIRFAGSASQLDPEALPADRANVERALSWLDNLRGGGGTEMIAGVKAALETETDPYRLRMVLFLTDGYIGNEAEILRRVGESLGDARIFSLGVGSSVNRFLLDRLAEAGRGTAEYLKPGESPDALVQRFYDRITDPVFTQLEIDWGGLDVVDVEPQRLPDLFSAQPLLVHARYRTAGKGKITLRGWSGSERMTLSTKIVLPRREEANASQAQLWARARVARLEMEKLRSEQADEITEEITGLALAHRLMTAYTSFVAVDRSERRTGGELVSVDQPVPMPEGVSYDAVFAETQRVAPPAPALTGHSGYKLKRSGFQQSAPKKLLRHAAIPDPTPSRPESVREQETAQVPTTMDAKDEETESPPQPAGSGVLRTGRDVPAPEINHLVQPDYPEAAQQARLEGVAVLDLVIDEQGSVRDAKVVRGLPMGLSESALAAVKQWRFEPTEVDGRPVPVQHIMTVKFDLGSGAAVRRDGPVHRTLLDQPILDGDSNEVQRIAFAASLLLLLLASGAWLLRRAVA